MTCAIHGASLQDTTTADEFLLEADNPTELRTRRSLHEHSSDVWPTTAKGTLMGVSTATARKLSVSVSFFLLRTYPFRPAWDLTQKATYTSEPTNDPANDTYEAAAGSGT